MKNPCKIPHFRKGAREIEPEIQLCSIYEFNILNKQTSHVLDHMFESHMWKKCFVDEKIGNPPVQGENPTRVFFFSN